MFKSLLETDPTPGVTEHQIIPYEPTRVSLTFFPPQTGTVTLFNEAGGAIGHGITLTAGSVPVRLWVSYHGEVVVKPWRAIYTAGATGVSWIAAYH